MTGFATSGLVRTQHNNGDGMLLSMYFQKYRIYLEKVLSLLAFQVIFENEI